jgi:hypothetical protein
VRPAPSDAGAATGLIALGFDLVHRTTPNP